MIIAAYMTEYEKRKLKRKRTELSQKVEGLRPKVATSEKIWEIPGDPLKTFIERSVFQKAGLFRGNLFDDPIKCPILFRYVSQSHRLYRYIYQFYGGQQEVMPEVLSLETFVTALKEAHIVDEPGLTYLQLLKILETEYPEIRPQKGSFVLNLPITFLEFFGLLVQIAPAYTGPVTSLAGITKRSFAKQTQNYKGKIVDAVDSTILTAAKNPNLVTDNNAQKREFDPDFFSMLGDGDGIKGMTDTADGVKDINIASHSEIDTRIKRLSAQVLTGDDPKKADEDDQQHISGPENVKVSDPSIERMFVHPARDPADHEFPPSGLPNDCQFFRK